MAERSRHLDGLRGVAALLVVADHALLAFDMGLVTGRPADSINDWDIALSAWPFFLPTTGDSAVTLFFLLSGYVLSTAFERSPLGLIAQATKRYLRLALPILTAVLIAYALLASGQMANRELAGFTHSSWLAEHFQQRANLVDALTEGLVRALFTGTPPALSYDTSLWTMPIEFVGSLLLIIVFCVARLSAQDEASRQRFLQVALSMLAVLLYSSNLGLFAIGAVWGRYGSRLRIKPTLLPLLLLAGLFLATIPDGATHWSSYHLLLRLTPPLPHQMPFGHSLLSFWHSLGAALILLAAERWPPFRRLLTARPCRWLGEISFPLYLIHVPLLMSVVSQISVALFAAGLGYATVAGLGIALLLGLSLGVAAVLTLLSERPAIALAGDVGRILHRIRWLF